MYINPSRASSDFEVPTNKAVRMVSFATLTPRQGWRINFEAQVDREDKHCTTKDDMLAPRDRLVLRLCERRCMENAEV